jgi:hypothetical protein
MSIISNLFSIDELQYLLELPEVIEARSKIDPQLEHSKIYFTIPLTDTIRTVLQERLGLDLSGISAIPMRWIKGDTPSHIDAGSTRFEKTYLVYLNNSLGELILGTDSYPITENTAYIFNEGIMHKTQNTGTTPRLLLGPMNEFVNPVGATITYYTNYADAAATNGNVIAYQGVSWVLGDPTYLTGSISPYTSWRIAAIPGYTQSLPTGVYGNGFDLATLGIGGYGFYVYPSAPCFLQGTEILCNVNNVDVYLPIENITTGTLVKTRFNGYKKAFLIGKGELMNPGNDERTENRLYKCSKSNYPELKKDIYITGCHSILVDELTDIQKEQTVEKLGKLFVTDRKYRLMASIDERAEPFHSEEKCTIWHIALESENELINYGIYASGLLVESCSINFLKNKSNMTFV